MFILCFYDIIKKETECSDAVKTTLTVSQLYNDITWLKWVSDILWPLEGFNTLL